MPRSCCRSCRCFCQSCLCCCCCCCSSSSSSSSSSCFQGKKEITGVWPIIRPLNSRKPAEKYRRFISAAQKGRPCPCMAFPATSQLGEILSPIDSTFLMCGLIAADWCCCFQPLFLINRHRVVRCWGGNQRRATSDGSTSHGNCHDWWDLAECVRSIGSIWVRLGPFGSI